MLVLGNSAEPWLAAGRDERAFLGFWSKALLLPLPDYASRRARARRCLCVRVVWPPPLGAPPRAPPRRGAGPTRRAAPMPRARAQLLWPGLFARHGWRLPYGFDLSTLGHLSEGFAAGAVDAAARGVLSPQRLARLRGGGGGGVALEEILQCLARVRGRARDAPASLQPVRRGLRELAACFAPSPRRKRCPCRARS